MEEIKVGEYVRTISGNIDKVDALIGMIENTVHLEKHKWQDIKNIVKHSPNIIDLIEEDDIGIMRYNGLIFKKFITKDDILELKFKNYELLEIVTKEQFNQVKYEV